MASTIISKDFILWETIKIEKGSYFIEYHPARTDYTIANLQLFFIQSLPEEETAQILEREFQEWTYKYSAYTFATAWDDKEDRIELTKLRPANTITGFYDENTKNLKMVWGVMLDEEVPSYIKEKEHLRKIYNSLTYKTGEQCAKDAEKYIKQMQVLKKTTKTWTFGELFIWPFIKKITFISIYLNFRSLIKAISKWDKFTGKREATPKEIEEENNKQKIKSWISHIERNPAGFERLVAENYEVEAKKRIQKQADELKKNNQ